jgi:hypothetical protein
MSVAKILSFLGNFDQLIILFLNGVWKHICRVLWFYYTASVYPRGTKCGANHLGRCKENICGHVERYKRIRRRCCMLCEAPGGCACALLE